MRWLVIALVLWGAISCNNVDHPPVLEPCDPERMKCGGSADSGDAQIGVGSDSGSGTGTDGDSWVGDIIVFSDDAFDRGSPYTGLAVVTAYGNLTYSTSTDYDGDLFILQDVGAENPNWFTVDPEDEGLMTTVQPVNTDRSPVDLTLGVADLNDVDRIFAELGQERAQGYAQVVLRVVDSSGRPIAGVQAPYEFGRVAYRDGATWTAVEGASTDGSGLIFLGDVGASFVGFQLVVSLTGSIEEDVSVLVRGDYLTVADVPFH